MIVLAEQNRSQNIKKRIFQLGSNEQNLMTKVGQHTQNSAANTIITITVPTHSIDQTHVPILEDRFFKLDR